MNDMATRILAAWYLLKQDKSYPAVKLSGGSLYRANMGVARAVARDGIILLKNENNILPIQNSKGLALIGQDAAVDSRGANQFTDRQGNAGTLAMGWGSGTAEFPVTMGSFSECKRG